MSEAQPKPKMEVVRVPVLEDNYSWLLFDPETREAGVVDPGEAGPVLAAAKERGWHLAQIWLTHWHPDHVGGVAEIKRAMGSQVTGPRAEADKIEGLDTLIDEGDVIRLAGRTASVMRVPGHTQGHVAFHFKDDGALFTGDTLFAMGCGKLFEGTPADMFANMQRYASMLDDTVVYCGHEYTQGNARFAVTVEPDNQALADRAKQVDDLRSRGEPTIPTTIGQEKATNPFLRAGSVEQLAERRAGKDAFRG